MPARQDLTISPELDAEMFKAGYVRESAVNQLLALTGFSRPIEYNGLFYTPVTMMRCAVCHGSANGVWVNQASGLYQGEVSESQQEATKLLQGKPNRIFLVPVPEAQGESLAELEAKFPKAFGLLKILSGAGMVIGGFGFTGGTGGIGAVVGGVLIAKGVDNLQTGVRQVWNNEPTETATKFLATKVGGEKFGTVIDFGTDALGLIANPSGGAKALTLTRPALTLTAEGALARSLVTTTVLTAKEVQALQAFGKDGYSLSLFFSTASKFGGAAQDDIAKGGTYKLKDQDGNVKRTGQTDDLNRRKGEHGRDPETKDLEFEIDRRSDSYPARRGREQIIYDQHPEAKLENGGLNKQRAVSPKNKRLEEYLEEGGKL